jgi:hypothetical protein
MEKTEPIAAALGYYNTYPINFKLVFEGIPRQYWTLGHPLCSITPR